MEERQIWIKDLLYRLLCGWRVILIAALVGAILLDGLAFMKAGRRYRAEMNRYQAEISRREQPDNQQLQEEIELAESALAREQIAKVKAAAAYTKGCRDTCEALVNYTESSMRFQANPSGVPTVELQYFVDSHYAVTYPEIAETDHTDDIMLGIDNLLISESTCRAMAQAVDADKDSAYYRELVETNHKGGTLQIQVIADTQENCEKLADVISETVEAQVGDLKPIFGDFSIALVGRSYAERPNSELLDEHIDTVDTIEDLMKNSKDLPIELSDDEEAYYELLLIDEDDQTDADAATAELHRPGLLYPKYVVLGLAVGFILSCVWLFLKIVISGVMLNPADCGEKVFGVLTTQEKPNRPLACVDRWLMKLFYRQDVTCSEENRMQLISAAADNAIKRGEMKHILVTGSSCDDALQNTKIALQQRISAQADEITVVNSMLTDPAVLPILSNADGVILVERIGVSNYNDIRAQRTICKDNDLPVIGCVVLR